MGEGRTRIDGYLDAADTRSTLAAMRILGAEVEVGAAGAFTPWAGGERPLGDSLRIRGVGLRGPAPAAIDVGNAGTLLRLLPGWLAGQDGGAWTLDGDDSIRQRPVDRVAVPLREMGADLRCREERLPPLEIRGAPLRGVEYELPVASAQVKSCVLLAGLLAEGETCVIEPLPTRDHTERMLAAAGATVERSPGRRDAPSPIRPTGSNPARSSFRPTSPPRPSSSSRRCWSAAARWFSSGSGSTRPGPAC